VHAATHKMRRHNNGNDEDLTLHRKVFRLLCIETDLIP
jgi:hypothetical protein